MGGPVVNELLDPTSVDADHLVQAGSDHPDLHILRDDVLFVKAMTIAEPGQLVVANVDGRFAVRRHDGSLEVHGLVVGVFRRVEP